MLITCFCSFKFWAIVFKVLLSTNILDKIYPILYAKSFYKLLNYNFLINGEVGALYWNHPTIIWRQSWLTIHSTCMYASILLGRADDKWWFLMGIQLLVEESKAAKHKRAFENKSVERSTSYFYSDVAGVFALYFAENRHSR